MAPGKRTTSNHSSSKENPLQEPDSGLDRSGLNHSGLDRSDLDPASEGPRRRKKGKARPGRFRRWVLRPIFWGLAVIATLAFLLQLWVDTPPARERARQFLVQQLSEYVGRPVSLQGVRFNLLPFHIELWDLVIGGRPGPGTDRTTELENAFLRIPYAYIEADLDALQNRKIHLQLLRLERPEIDLRFYPDGSDNLISTMVNAEAPELFELWIDQVEIERAALDLDHERARITVDAYHLRTRLRGLGGFRLAGNLTSPEVAVRLPESKTIRVAVSASGILERDQLKVEHARITHRSIHASVTGDCEWRRDRWQFRNCTFQTRGDGRGAALRDLGYFRSLIGGFTYDGVFAWRPGAVGWRGQVQADDVLLWGRRLRRLQGSLSADRFRVELDLDQVEYSGGTLAGRVVADLEAPGDPITADLEVRDLHLDTLLADQNIPVQGLAARVDGHLLYTCDLRQGLIGNGRAEVDLRPDPVDPGLPVAGSFPLRIVDGWILADSADVASERQSLLAVGAYHLDLSRGRFDYELATADVSELVPLLPFDGEPPSYFPTGGRGTLAGTLQLESGFAYNTLSLDLGAVQTPSMPLGRISGRLDVTPWALENLHLDLRHNLEKPEQQIVVRGRMPWSGAAGLTRLTFDASEWPMEKVHPWIPFHLPLDGKVTGRLDLELDGDSQQGELSASLTPAFATGLTQEPVPLGHLVADLSWDDSKVDIERISAFAEAGELTARGHFQWPSGEMDLRLHSDNLDIGLAPLQRFLPRPDVHTTLVVDAHLAGRLDDPSCNITVEADRLTVGSREIAGSPGRLDAFWSSGKLELGGYLLDGASIEGGGRLEPPIADLEFELESRDLSRIIQLLSPTEHRVGGSLNGRLTLAGDFSQARPLDAGLELDALDVTLDGRRLVAQPPLRLAFAADSWTIERLLLEEPASDSRIEVQGKLGYHLGADVDLQTRAELDGAWLRVALPDLQVDGRLGLEGRVTGSLDHPTLVGSGSLEQGNLQVPGLDQGFEGLNGALRFHGDHISLDHLAGNLSGGTAVVTGELRWQEQGPPSYRLDLDAQGVVLPSVEGWRLSGDAALALRSVPEGHLLSGTADLTQLDYREDIRFDFAQIVQELLRGRRLEVETADSFRSSIQLGVRIRADETVSLRNNIAELTGSADLQVRGNLAQPILFGELVMDRGGTMVYNSEDYRLKRGRLVFADPYRLDPEVDLVATTKVRDFDVTLSLSGPLDRLEARFSSEPPLPDVEVLRLLAGGDAYVDQTELVPDRSNQLDEERENSAATFLYGQAASAIGDRVNTLFGFDKFRIDPLTGSGDNLSTARVTVGKRLSKDVFLTYSVDPSSSDNQRIRVEWQLTDTLVLVLTQNGDDSFSADARWENTF